MNANKVKVVMNLDGKDVLVRMSLDEARALAAELNKALAEKEN